jgi:hypothetical protein
VARCIDIHSISACIIQSSAIGPPSYIIAASDLHPVTSGNVMDKYADDTYLIIPASNNRSCAVELAQINKWARENYLHLNREKSVEIVFVSPQSKQALVIPPPAVCGI